MQLCSTAQAKKQPAQGKNQHAQAKKSMCTSKNSIYTINWHKQGSQPVQARKLTYTRKKSTFATNNPQQSNTKTSIKLHAVHGIVAWQKQPVIKAIKTTFKLCSPLSCWWKLFIQNYQSTIQWWKDNQTVKSTWLGGIAVKYATINAHNRNYKCNIKQSTCAVYWPCCHFMAWNKHGTTQAERNFVK